jgi:hypothetical protein
MAPEQAFGGPPDPRSDLYALGTTWYYALTAQAPYPGSALDALIRHRDEPPPEIRNLRPEITERASGLLRRLMAKKVDERPPDAHTLLKEMLSIGMLLDTDTSGSPFKILPAAPRLELKPPPPSYAPPPPCVDPLSARVPWQAALAAPLPPPIPAVAAPLGSKSSYIVILAACGILTFGWQWRRAGPADWPAGAFILALLPALLTYGERTNVWRKVIGGGGTAAALLCWGRHVYAGDAVAPCLEAAIFAGVGVCALGGATYLGQWGQDRSEAVWARVLSPLASACLLGSALLWSAPETQALSAAFAERSTVWWGAFAGSGGAWRWLGVVCVALGAAVHLRVQTPESPKDRRLNWNK